MNNKQSFNFTILILTICFSRRWNDRNRVWTGSWAWTNDIVYMKREYFFFSLYDLSVVSHIYMAEKNDRFTNLIDRFSNPIDRNYHMTLRHDVKVNKNLTEVTFLAGYCSL